MKKQGFAWILLVAVAFAACTKEVPQPPDAAVDPAFEMTPPIAADVTVQRLEDNPAGNVLVVADFGSSALRSPFHAVELSTGKVVLRDDGQGGDAAAGDKKYSVVLTEDLEQLTADLETAQKNALETLREPPPTFRGRQLVPADLEALRKFNVEAFRTGGVIAIPFWFCLHFLDPSPPHSLMVTDVAVVEDPTRANNPCSGSPSATGAWSFGKLTTDMANTAATGVSPEDFVKSWLATWLADATVNGDLVPQRANLFNLVIRPWLIKSGSAAGSFDITNWMTKPLDLKFAPFKLTAIVNRLDLRGNGGYGFANPGEGRFVFETVNPNTCAPLSPGFTVIFEYGLPIHGCVALKAYGQKWYDLKNQALGSPAYNQALQDLTDVFAKANAAASKPNGSALNQIRTNEIVLSSPWELREFNIDAASHLLALTTVKQEPAKKYNAKAVPAGAAADVTLMASWVNANEADVVADRHQVPLTLSTGENFLGGKSHTEFGGIWDAAPMEITGDEARHHFSLNTCSGCHGGETSTQFLHVRLAPFGAAATLSGFLTGITVADPAGRPTGSPASRTFNDLERRKGDLERFLCTKCGRKIPELVEALRFKPLHMTH